MFLNITLNIKNPHILNIKSTTKSKIVKLLAKNVLTMPCNNRNLKLNLVAIIKNHCPTELE